MLEDVLVLQELHVVVPDPLEEREYAQDRNDETLPKGAKLKPPHLGASETRGYLQQVGRHVKVEVLPVLLLQLHPLIEQHVGTVGLEGGREGRKEEEREEGGRDRGRERE